MYRCREASPRAGSHEASRLILPESKKVTVFHCAGGATSRLDRMLVVTLNGQKIAASPGIIQENPEKLTVG
jgi:hypothetical protein